MNILSGRGVKEGVACRPWRYRLEVDAGLQTIRGELVVEGWEESRAMADWAEAHLGDNPKLELEGKGVEVELVLTGVRIHESGHYSETDIQVKGRIIKCP